MLDAVLLRLVFDYTAQIQIKMDTFMDSAFPYLSEWLLLFLRFNEIFFSIFPSSVKENNAPHPCPPFEQCNC